MGWVGPPITWPAVSIPVGRRVQLPPGPQGTVPLAEIRGDPLGFLSRLVAEYGDFTRHLTDADEVITVSRPDLARRVLVDRSFRKTGTPDDTMLSPVLGRGLLTSEGETWKRQRRIAQPAFERRRVEGMADVIVQETESLLARWVQASSATPVRIDHDLSSLTLAIVARAILGSEASGLGPGFGKAVETLNRFMGHYDPLAPGAEGARARAEFAAALQMLDGLVNMLVAGRSADPQQRDDLMGRLLTEGFRGREIRDQVLTMLMAGHETTAKALGWSLVLLDAHPSVGARLDAELKALDGPVDGRLDGPADGWLDGPADGRLDGPADGWPCEPAGRRVGCGALNLDHLRALPSALQVVQEALRLFPPVWLVSRRATEERELDGFRIPAGALVCVSPYILHRDPSSWPEPERFLPERFAPGAPPPPEGAYMPFSDGPRQCIGERFALLEAQIVLAMIRRSLRIELVPAGIPEPEALVTLRPRDGLTARLAPR